jgi:hypothetical protein
MISSGEILSPPKRHQNIFFNEKIPLCELKRLAGLDDEGTVGIGEAWMCTKERYVRWMSQSCATVTSSAYRFHKNLGDKRYGSLDDLQLTPPPPGFRISPRVLRPKSLCSELSYEANLTPMRTGKVPEELPIQTESCELSSPPKKMGLCKREGRGKFTGENVTEDRHTGTLKFYQLKKRFGFITLEEDESDVFLCEDDIVLSGIHHKHFKDTVLNKNAMRFSFRIKTYEEQGRIKRKAIEIQLA